MAVELTPQELSRRYNRVARWYDRVEGVLGLVGVSMLRRRVLQQASGKVLEVAVGTGKNLPYYPYECRIIAVDLSREMLNIAQKRAAKLSMNVSFLLADAEALPFSDESFDTVVSSLSTCTFPNPVAALAEMARVCRPKGKSFSWSMAEAIVSGLGGGKIAMLINLQSRLVVIGTESRLISYVRRV